MRVSFSDKLSVVVVHDSCTCGLLFCSMRFLLFAETPSFYGALWHHEIHGKVLEFVDNNEIFERNNPLSHFWSDCNKRSDELCSFLKSHLQLRLLRIIVLAFFAIRAYPVGNNGSGYAVLSHKAGNCASIRNVRANTFSSDFVWYSSPVFFSPTDIIIYPAEVLQIHCTTTVIKQNASS